jgi:K+-sensing histidine kinase KdpD
MHDDKPNRANRHPAQEADGKEVCRAARERDADAIVLGSQRRRRFGRLFSTQVREQTTRITELPVLTAPSPLEGVTRGRAETIDLNVRLQDFMRSSS